MAVEEILAVGLIIFLFVIGGLLFAKGAEAIQGTPIDNAYSAGGQEVFDHADMLIIAVALFMHLGILLFAYLAPSSPPFLIVGFLLAVVTVWVTGNSFAVLDTFLATNTFSSLAITPTLQAFSRLYPFLSIGFLMAFFFIFYGRTGVGSGAPAGRLG